MWDTFESDTDPVKQKQDKIKNLKQNGERKLNEPDSCMLMMSVPSVLPKRLEAHMDDPSKIFEIICDKYDKKGNNKLSNLCKELENAN